MLPQKKIMVKESRLLLSEVYERFAKIAINKAKNLMVKK